MDRKSPSVSIIVATYNRKEDLKELLDSLTSQVLSLEQFEVIIIDDGSTDGTGDYIRSYVQQSPLIIEYFYQENQGPGKARSVGMEKARGEIFVFIDSDCIVPPHYLKTVETAFNEQTIDAFGGPDKSAEFFSEWDKAVNYTMTSFLTTGGLRGKKGKSLARFYPRSFNMGFRREVFEKIGGFGSIFQYGEDIEFSHRIIKSGAKVVFLPDAYVHHRRRSTLSAFARQVYKMGKARVQLRSIDRELLEPLHVLPAVGLILLCFLIVGALVSGTLRNIALLIFVAGILFLFVLSLHGSIKSNSLKTLFLIPIAFCTQVTAYGAGMIVEFVRQFLTAKGK